MVSAPRPAAAGSGLKGGWLVAVATVLAILLCAAALFIMIRRLVLQPISALDRATREIGRGNLLAPVPDAGAPELRALADAFRTMGVSLHRSSEEARHLAYHDALTGLPNRTLLREKLEGAVAAARRGGQLLGVIFLDLDNFKQVNDTLGHARGDDLLAAVAELLCRSLRGSDLIARPATGSHPEEVVARLGGDEFTILLPAIHHERDAGQVAERIIDSLSRPVTLAGHQIHVGASIGITLFPADGDDAETLLKNADIAMYHAKDRGKNNFQFFSQAMNDRVSRRLGLEHRIRDALANDAFSLVYQPIVEVVSGRMVGVEALLRWIDPEGGGVSTGEMVAVAEECGLILDLGEWVLQEACRQAAAWPVESREEPFIAVNISGVQLTRGDIRHLVARTLAATGFDPRRLQLELTESSFLEVSEETHRGLSRLNELGVQICLDDFGTGYSSLGHLRTLPISRLKIDHSFVRDIDHGDGDHPLLSSIIALAHSLDLAVTAEGVETPEQLRFLERHGCDCVQGWLLGRPMPAAMVAGRLHERRRASGGSP
jgi:diguanylate cyclase (GGDEF)-like protein